MFNARMLKYFVMKNGLSLEDIANSLGVNPSTLYRKMRGDSDFTRTEITIIRDRLHLTNEDVASIFFAHDFA